MFVRENVCGFYPPRAKQSAETFVKEEETPAEIGTKRVNEIPSHVGGYLDYLILYREEGGQAAIINATGLTTYQSLCDRQDRGDIKIYRIKRIYLSTVSGIYSTYH